MNQPLAELRTDWLTSRSVLVAENRALRPNDFASEAASAGGKTAGNTSLATCPFCVGNEFRTPPAIYEKLDQQGRWQIRVVPNMYPAVTLPAGVIDVPPVVATASESFGALQQTVPAVGAHEVIIECANHIDRMSAISAQELRVVLEAYAERLRHWRDDGRFRYSLVFKNQGPRAGASIAHLHSQLIAVPFVPPTVAAEAARASEAYSRQQQCPYCEIVATEQAAGDRVVACRDGFIAFCPFASWQPFEFWLMPIDHKPSFELATPNDLDRLTDVLYRLISRLESIVPDAAYNMLLRTAPWIGGCDVWSHWRIEMLPRINALAGLEVATGVHINPLAPERAALQLRLGQSF
jgi:UDPglucose--hexose-1-phosphate uridylyltransferase